MRERGRKEGEREEGRRAEEGGRERGGKMEGREEGGKEGRQEGRKCESLSRGLVETALDVGGVCRLSSGPDVEEQQIKLPLADAAVIISTV